MTHISRVLFDESHNSAWTIRPEVAARVNPHNPADSGYVRAAQSAELAGFKITPHVEGPLTEAVLADFDVVILPHGADDNWDKTVGSGSPKLTLEEIESLKEFVARGGGLMILGETEYLKYGNSHHELAAAFGVEFLNETIQDNLSNVRDVATWIKPQQTSIHQVDVFARVNEFAMYRAGALKTASADTHIIAVSSPSATPSGVGVASLTSHGSGRVAILMDSDLFGDDSIFELDNETFFLNLLSWLSPRQEPSAQDAETNEILETRAWNSLVTQCEKLRPLQAKDGSIIELEKNRSAALEAARQIQSDISELIPFFSHQEAHLLQTITDFDKWIASDFSVPDFYDSLDKFRPEQHRVNGLKNLVVFPMYTQNGNLNRNFEAVITNTFWPDWLAYQEKTKYNNPAFVPIEFVGFTAGYNTHSAVLFPETFATRETAKFTWGGIFCDRESARFRRISAAAADLLKLRLPADAELLLQRQSLAQKTFVLWDLIHDRAHSHGDLPFDPFMIKQRMPFWMYALEELRCDLNTYRETLNLEKEGVYLGRFIRYAILFDRLFRFPITGERVRNYDGLGGQILFAWLHQNGVLRWTDNVLSIDWNLVDDSVVALCEQVDLLYREGIDRSRISHWLSTHEFVASLVEPHPASKWAKGVEALPIEGELKHLTDAVLPDEFPLNVFYEALRTKLAPTIESVRGITS